MNVYTFPTGDELGQYETINEDYTHPNRVPYAVVVENALSPDACERIIAYGHSVDTHNEYHYPGCEATTVELKGGLCPELGSIASTGYWANQLYFGFGIEPSPVSWMQTYETGDSYQIHMDGAPGQTRKLTALAFLSPESQYEGGQFRFIHPPSWTVIPAKQGTIVIFQHWLLHEVLPVTSGLRQTINMGFWGPPFK